MSTTIEERVKKIIGEQLGVKQEEVLLSLTIWARILLTPLSW